LPNEIKWALLNLFLIFTLIAPGISLLVLRNRKMISSIEIHDRTQRFFPILLMFFYSIALFLLLFLKTKDNSIPHFIFTFPLAGALVSIALFAANYILKILKYKLELTAFISSNYHIFLYPTIHILKLKFYPLLLSIYLLEYPIVLE
jgi:hypothetical protein